jgi:hypothetical protein
VKDIVHINVTNLYKDIGWLYVKRLRAKSSSSKFSSHPSYVSQGHHVTHRPIFKDGNTAGWTHFLAIREFTHLPYEVSARTASGRRLVTFNWRNKVEQDRQCTYNIILRCVHANIFQWKSNKYYISLLCTCGRSYRACNAHASHCRVWPVRVYEIFPHYLTNSTS